MSTCAVVRSFIESKTTEVQTSNVGFTSEVSDWLPCGAYGPWSDDYKLRIGHTEQCPCGTGSQTTEHLLQSCPTYEPLRKGIWPDHTPVPRMLYGSLGDLRCTATFIEETGVSIWRTRRRDNCTCRHTEIHVANQTFYFNQSQYTDTGPGRAVCSLVGCVASQQHASVSQGRICSDNCTCCHTDTEVAAQIFQLTQSRYTYTGPTNLSTAVWQDSH